MANTALPHDHGQNDKRILENMPGTADFEAVAELFKQLCDVSRIRIFWTLCHCEECVANLACLVGMSSPAVSHHLRQLKNSGLITARRSGKEVYYKASETPQAALLHEMIEKLMAAACPTGGV